MPEREEQAEAPEPEEDDGELEADDDLEVEADGTDCDIFLKKVRLGRKLDALMKKDLSGKERRRLENIRDLYLAGVEAQQSGAKEAAGALYRRAEKALVEWLKTKRVRRATPPMSPMPPQGNGPKEKVSQQWVLGEGAYAGEEKTIQLPGNVTMEMVWCPAGSFTMGSPEEEDGRWHNETQHLVTLTKGIWMAKYVVTQMQWKSVMGNNPSWFKDENLPVENVSWNDAKEFCRKAGMGLRLPTEAEWEYACRAGSGTAYFWGNELNGERANCNGNYPCGATAKGPYQQKTTPVGNYEANAWGLCDMHGNVWEWCEDKYLEDLGPQAVTNPVNSATGSDRVLRGGSWSSSAWYCRSAGRSYNVPTFWSNRLGFRPCCSVVLP